MSDERLRELERRWKETGAVHDESAWLRARVQVGSLTEDRLRFAALCGHAASLAASEASAPWEPPALTPFEDAELQAHMTATGYWEGQVAEAWAYAVADQGKEPSLVAVRALQLRGLCSPTDVRTIEEIDPDWSEGCHEFLGHVFLASGEHHGSATVIDATRAALVPWALGYVGE